MSEYSEFKLTLTDLYLADEEPFAEVYELNRVYGDFRAAVAGVPFPEMEVISSGEVNLRQAMDEMVGLRRIKQKKSKMSFQIFRAWSYTGKVERDHDSLFLTIRKGRTPVDGFDRVELSRAQVMEEISVFKKTFLKIATEKSTREQAEALWDSITNEPVDDTNCNFWKW